MARNPVAAAEPKNDEEQLGWPFPSGYFAMIKRTPAICLLTENALFFSIFSKVPLFADRCPAPPNRICPNRPNPPGLGKTSTTSHGCDTKASLSIHTPTNLSRYLCTGRRETTKTGRILFHPTLCRARSRAPEDDDLHPPTGPRSTTHTHRCTKDLCTPLHPCLHLLLYDV